MNDSPVPELKDGQCLIKNAFVGLNFIDTSVSHVLVSLSYSHPLFHVLRTPEHVNVNHA